MKTLTALLLLFFSLVCAHAQVSNIEEEFALPAILNESSGAIMLQGKLITHNDSGGQNALYELDLTTETVTRTITITNATNIDWEDIAQDDTFIYVGDFGNNNGNRTDLKVYKINKTDFLNNTSVTAEVISFSYANQSDFTSNPQNTIWDAEALISLDASNLVLISKNWVNNVSNAYLVSKTPGTYSLIPLSASLDSGGLITGGAYNDFSGNIYLVGYTSLLQPFVWVCNNYVGNDIFSGTNTNIPTTEFSSLGFEQIEGITYISANEYLLTSESFSRDVGSITLSDYAKLISFSTSDVTLSEPEMQSEEYHVSLFPNPVEHVLKIKGISINNVEIFNMQSAKLYSGNSNEINVSLFSSGVYLVKVNFKDDTSIMKRIVKQ